MKEPCILTFDTSAINHLADDADSAALLAGIRSGFHTRFTFTTISEVVATGDSRRRRQLLSLCKLLLSSGDCIDPQNELLTKLIEAFDQSPSFDWAAVRVDFPEARDEIARNENFEDELASQEREESRAIEKQFRNIYENAKPAFDKLFKDRTEKRPTNVADLVHRLQVPGGAFWKLAAGIYSRVGRESADEGRMRRLVEQCDPFRALMIATCAAQYDRCIRPQKVGPSLKSGSNDTFMAVCLPYCHCFITSDPGQLNCFREVAPVAGLRVTLVPYSEFREGLLVAGLPAPIQTRATASH